MLPSLGRTNSLWSSGMMFKKLIVLGIVVDVNGSETSDKSDSNGNDDDDSE